VFEAISRGSTTRLIDTFGDGVAGRIAGETLTCTTFAPTDGCE
jgi:hypothetical protein